MPRTITEIPIQNLSEEEFVAIKKKRPPSTDAEYIFALEQMYTLLEYDKINIGINYKSMAETVGLTDGQMINLKTIAEELGILKTSVVVNPLVNGIRTRGRQATWQLVVPFETAKKRIVEWRKTGQPWSYTNRKGFAPKITRKNKPVELPVTIAQTDKEETRAIAGPEPEKPFDVLAPLRKDEPAALIEAAKQYANRWSDVENKYQELIRMGIQVDKEVFLRSIKMPRNEFLETLTLVLPIITDLQTNNEKLLRQLNDARDKTKDYLELKKKYEVLQKLQHDRIAERVNSG